jgi:hypothetical protein
MGLRGRAIRAGRLKMANDFRPKARCGWTDAAPRAAS